MLGLTLLWIAWAAIVTAIMALSGFDWTLLGVAMLFFALAAGLILGARVLTPSWYRLLVGVTAAYGVVSVVRAALDRARAAELIVVAAISLVCSAALEIGRRVRRRYLV